MLWYICYAIALTVLVASVIVAIIKEKTKFRCSCLPDSLKILVFGVCISSICVFIPIYSNTFSQTNNGIIETFFISIHTMLRMFLIDVDFDLIVDNINGLTDWFYCAYSVLSAVLFLLAPLLTFGFVLSFFKNFSAYRRYLFNYRKNVYIFSELNEKSLALAQSISETDKDILPVFTEAFNKGEESSLISCAKELGAICFKKDILTHNFLMHSKNSDINFYLIGENESDNIVKALRLIPKYKERENTHLYVFSAQFESEMLLSKVDKGKIKVRRINEVQSLVYRLLYDKGERIFDSAYENNGIKNISAVVIGLGKHGTEMLKSLPWFCQMDGYRVEINAYDSDNLATDKFTALCPELMASEYNNKFDDNGDAQYSIKIHDGVDFETNAFFESLRSLGNITYAFVALGSDEQNIKVAVQIKSLFEKMKLKEPFIQAVVLNSEKSEALTGITNYSGQEYKIDFVGDIKTSYSAKVILKSDLEEKALKRHCNWGEEDEFWLYEYNYRSSVASAIHREMKIRCKIAGAQLSPDKRTKEELWALRRLEHRRWNAYMRSEGYCYSGSTDKSSRNNLAKLHNCLVTFDELPIKEQEKDDD